MMWLQGPAGVGKSALAQSCAQEAGGKLAAAFFFSRPNSRDDSRCFFTSIAYQLATKHPSYYNKLQTKLVRDPTLVQKAIAVQFQELIALPLQELQKEGKGVDEGVIFIDGLDECDGEDAQCAIIDIVSSSVRERSTPFIWAFFSRPEPHIVARFSSHHVHELCWKLTLPISRDADGEIELYLRDGFKRIRIQYGIPSNASWPSNGNIRELVRRSAGLFAYAASILRYVAQGGPLGPEEQLRLVLRLPGSSINPWSRLDAFYTYIMEQIPKAMLPNTLKLLSSYKLWGEEFLVVAAAGLGFSLSTFCAALSKLHSVIKLTYSDDGFPEDISVYHASFTDYLEDPLRSGRFCIKTPEIYASLLADVIKLYDKGFENGVYDLSGPRACSDRTDSRCSMGCPRTFGGHRMAPELWRV